MNDTPINLSSQIQQPVEEPISLTPAEADYRFVSEQAAQRRAFMSDFAQLTPDRAYPDLLQTFMRGEEPIYRREAAASYDHLRGIKLQETIAKIAKEKQGPLTPQEVYAITEKFKELSKPSNPEFVIEDTFGKSFMGAMYKAMEENPDSHLNTALQKDPAAFKLEVDRAGGLVSKREYVLRRLQDAKNDVSQQSYIGWGIDILKGFVPSYPEIKLSGHTPNSSVFWGATGLGNTLEKQSLDLFRLPMEDFTKKVDEIYNNLKRDNPTMAVEFLEGMAGMATQDVFLKNFFSAISVAPIPGLRATQKVSGGILSKSATEAAEAAKTAVKASNAPELNKAVIAEAVGDLKEAAVQRVTHRLLGDMQGTTKPIEQVLEAIPHYLKLDIENIKANPGTWTADQINRLEQAYISAQNNIVEAITKRVNVDRTPALLATETEVRKFHDAVKDMFPGVRNNIADITAPVYNQATRAYTYDVILLSNTGKLFGNEATAKNFIKIHGLELSKASIEPKGIGFYIRLTKPLDETMDVIRDGMHATKITKEPESFVNTFFARLSKYRSPDDTSSPAANQNRKIATYGQSVTTQAAIAEADYMSALARSWRKGKVTIDDTGRPVHSRWDPPEFDLNGKKIKNRDRWNDLRRVLEIAKTTPDPQTGIPGYYMKSIDEIQDFYTNHFKRLPSEGEVHAYFAIQRLDEFDRIERTLNLLSKKQRLGAEQHSFFTVNKEGKTVQSPFFEGIVRKEIPRGTDTVMVVGDTFGKEQFWHRGRRPSTKKLLELEKKVKEGVLKVIEIIDPDLRQLKGYSDKLDSLRVRYVITPTLETKDLDFFAQVPRRGGGHFQPDYDFYIKQAIIRPERIGKQAFSHWYEGDQTVMPITIRGMGEDLAKKLDEARKLLRAGRDADAEAYVKANLPMEWSEFKGYFKPRYINGVKHPAQLNLEEPIQLVRKGETIGKIDNQLAERYPGTFEDGTRRGSAMKTYQVEYTQERSEFGLRGITDIGTKGKPVYAYEPARYLDPLETANRAVSRIINSAHMDDYKIFAVEDWMRRAENFLVEGKDGARYSPFYHFNHPEFLQNTPSAIKEKLLADHRKIQMFLGYQSSTDSALYNLTLKLADTMYTKFGPKGVIIDPSWMLPKLTDPFRFIRAATFHMAIGLFSLPQLMVQNMTYSVIASAAGTKYAGSAMTGAFYTQLSRINSNPAIINHLDDLITKMRMPGSSAWKPGEFKESLELLKRTGFNNVAGEYSLLDSSLSPRMFKSAMHSFLDAGAIFFREGERNVRYGAWHAAYREFRDANPTAKIGDKEIRQILDRADLLSGNMSRASSSLLHQGVMSIPSQFLAYQIRQAELFLGKRLGETTSERMAARGRMFAVNMALFGLPMATGITGIPFADSIRKYALENGYVVGDNFMTSAIMEGLPAIMLAMATGGGDISKGNKYNFGDRYGSGGFEWLREATSTDKSMLEIFGGAAYSKFSGTIGAMNGFWAAMMSGIRGDDKAFKLSPKDFIDVLQEISSVNAVDRFALAVNTGKWYSKKEAQLTDTTWKDALFMTITGLQPASVSDLHLKSKVLKDQKKSWDEGEKRAVIEFKRGIQAMNDKNQEQADQFFTRGFYFLDAVDYPHEKRHIPVSKAFDRENLVDAVDWDFYIERVFGKKIQPRAEAYKQILKQRETK